MTSHNKAQITNKFVTINGITVKAKACKRCNTMTAWFDNYLREIDNSGLMIHTRQRCGEIQNTTTEVNIASLAERPTVWRGEKSVK
jgi:hypothetical protein